MRMEAAASTGDNLPHAGYSWLPLETIRPIGPDESDAKRLCREVIWSNTGVTDELLSIAEAFEEADSALLEGNRAASSVLPTGFGLLDTYLGGGLRGGELTLVGGPHGLGKTAFMLQLARHAASLDQAAVIFSYEHDSTTLLERLITVEAGEMFGLEGIPLRRVREALEGRGRKNARLEERLASTPGGVQALTELRRYGERLLLHRSSGSTTGLNAIRDVLHTALARSGLRPLVVVDYLQKVMTDRNRPEDDRVSDVVIGLKDIALEFLVPVVAVVAADNEGLTPGRRLRVNHLRGPSTLAYEADVVLIMNEKYDVVARHHLVYDIRKSEHYRDYVVLSIEKNRSGLARIDLQLRKRLEQSRFEREIELVPEELVDERLFME
jgi:replicative DNA helicase